MGITPINLQLGWPTPRLFPSAELAEATTACLNNNEIAKDALVYGPDLGYTPLRRSIATWLSSFYQPSSGPTTFDRIAITGGASQNLASILQVFSDPVKTQRIWMVEPVYFLACTVFQDAGFSGKLRGAKEDEQGIDIAFLRKALSDFEESAHDSKSPTKPESQYEKIYRHILYTTPTFSNPSARTMSPKVREELIGLAREFDLLIISDDVYDFLRWPSEGNPSQKLATIPPRFVDLDRATAPPGAWGNSISNGSFSKIVAPGVRVGWAEGSEKAILRLSQNGATRSGGAPSQLTSTFLHHLVHTGALQAHIDNVLIPTYRVRYAALMSSIATHLSPLGVTVTSGASYTVSSPSAGIVPAGGFFTYITFPPELPTADVIAKRAKDEYGLTIAFGGLFVVKGDYESARRAVSNGEGAFGRGARLCWAWEEEEMIKEGILRLAELLGTMLKETRVDS